MRGFLCIATVCAVCAGPAPAYAADIADHRVLGFTPDGGTFAFEEFGVQDGSGFPFANIFVIETASDSWLPGTPFRVLIDDETVPLAEARRRAREAAAPVLEKVGLQDTGLVLASSPLGAFAADPVSLDFGALLPSDALAPPTARWRASLEIFPADTPGHDCETMLGEPPNGFRLRVENLDSGAVSVLHEDEAVPQSRGCPITYRLSEVVVPDGLPVTQAVVLVSVIGLGFEGAGRRFMAVAGKLPD